MKTFKLSTLSALSVGALFSLSLNAKTLIVDDFLKYQDTSNMQFDFAQPNTGLTPYESQFYVRDFYYCQYGTKPNPDKSDEFFPRENSDEIYNYVKKCKNEDYPMNEFETRRHKKEFYEDYINEYKQYWNEIKAIIADLDRVEIRNVWQHFQIHNYDFDSEMYAVDDHEFESFFDDSTFEKNILRRLVSNQFIQVAGYGLVNDPLKVYGLDGPLKESEKLFFKLPVDVAELLHNNAADMVFSFKVNLKVNPECMFGVYWDTYKSSISGECSDGRKSVELDDSTREIQVEIVKKNAAYNLSYEMLRNKYGKDMSQIIEQLNNRQVIYSTNVTIK